MRYGGHVSHVFFKPYPLPCQILVSREKKKKKRRGASAGTPICYERRPRWNGSKLSLKQWRARWTPTS